MGSLVFFDDWIVRLFAVLAVCVSTVLAAKTILATRQQFQLVKKLRLSHKLLAADLATDDLSAEPLGNALDNIEAHARTFNPDHIVGVHLGGRLLSTIICRRMSIPDSRCHYLETGRVTGSLPKLRSSANEPPNGKVLVVDDITRGGTTISSASKFFVNQAAQNHLKISELNFATLVQVVTPTKAERGYIAPDWSAHRTNTETFQLAWTPVSSLVESIYRTKDPDWSQPEVEFFERLVSDFDFAHHIALLAIEDIDRVNAISSDISYYHTWKEAAG